MSDSSVWVIASKKLMADAVFDGVTKAVAWICAAIIVLGLIGSIVDYPQKDDTDPSGGRSGLKIYTDSGTGCQYLSVSGGGVTPRLSADGHPICGVQQ
ncbi:hypothetical protein [Aeromonas phage 51]|uniref:DUF6440 domain-containing protein n=3 Tax=Popoffvirus pv56 TaxID=2560283 RepID=A0A219YC07_9CAUD|nr:hypothetical protein F394_gp10 [Aeromonas phage vB_AsaM-56]AFC22606.1 hypothetical protein AsaM-56_0010 [Aeromonas phage vB_AsaM-56]APU01233.1 hypothetical protein [Aeromonas phage 51]APU01317.1 hypothetical protein [Aeromonas phage 56]